MEDGRTVVRAHAPVGAACPDPPAPVGEFLRPLRRGWLAITLGATIGLAAGLTVALLQKPVYEARTLIEIQSLNTDFLNTRTVDPGLADPEAGSYVQTEMKLLESDPLVQRTAEKLGAGQRPEYRNSQGFPFGRPAPGNAPASRQRLLDQLQDALKVRALGTSRILEASFQSNDAAFAADFVNTLAQEFIRNSVDSRTESARAVARQLSDQLGELKGGLEKSESALQQYARSAGLVFTADHDSAAGGRYKQLQDGLQKAQDLRVQAQTRYERVLSSPPDSLPEILDDPALRAYQGKLTDLKQQAADLGAVLQPAHYKVKQVQAQIDALQAAMATQRANVLRRLRTEYETAREREKMLAGYYEQQAGAVADEAAKSVRYDVLRSEVETNRQLYDSMLQRVKEAGIASEVRAAHMRVAAPAETPDLPVRPKPPLYGAAGLFCGLVAGMLFAFARPAAATVIRGPGDAAAYLSIPELAAIPDTPRRKVAALRRGSAGDGPAGLELTAWRDPYSRLAEAFRGAAASVLFCTPGSSHRVIVVTSPCSGEGKTTVAANLGAMLAASGNRVLLIDGDMRRPALHKVFGLENVRGLSELLSDSDGERAPMAFEIGSWTEIPGLTVLPSGAKPADAGSLLASPAMPRLIGDLRRLFDFVVIDTPPLALSDARVFGQASDGAVVVVRAGRTCAGDASLALLRLAEDGTRVLGTVVNRWNPKRRSQRAYGSYLYYMPDSYFKV
jgi:capsular exopolysaccharide synthesis family protein